MRINTVGDLKEYLEEFEDELPVMIVHQPSWPLREYIGGLWLDDGTPEEEFVCEECGRLTLEDPKEDASALVEANTWYRECFKCGHLNECAPPMPKEEQVLYLVANGHPYEGSPYGSKRAWEVI